MRYDKRLLTKISGIAAEVSDSEAARLAKCDRATLKRYRAYLEASRGEVTRGEGGVSVDNPQVEPRISAAVPHPSSAISPPPPPAGEIQSIDRYAPLIARRLRQGAKPEELLEDFPLAALEQLLPRIVRLQNLDATIAAQVEKAKAEIKELAHGVAVACLLARTAWEAIWIPSEDLETSQKLAVRFEQLQELSKGFMVESLPGNKEAQERASK